MSNILIRDIPEKTIKHLKAMAEQHNRSLQQELKRILENMGDHLSIDVTKRASVIREKLRMKGIDFSDSAELLREDRHR